MTWIVKKARQHRLAVMSSLNSLVNLALVLFFCFVYTDIAGAEVGAKFDIQKLKQTVNKSIDDVIDATWEQMKNVYHPGNPCPFRKNILSKLQTGEDIHIYLLGGSVTYGADLKDRLSERWSNYFEQIMQSGWYSSAVGKVHVKNMGVGACNIDTWVTRTHEFKDADMVIVDLSVNDQGFELQSLTHYYHTLIQLLDQLPKKPAILFNYAFRTAKYDKSDIKNHCPVEGDGGSCCNGYVWCRRWWDMQDYVAIALNRFQVPYISYRDLFWPVYAEPPSNLPVIWNGMSHPDAKTHKMFAKEIAFAFTQQLEGAMNTDIVCKQQDNEYSSPHHHEHSPGTVCKNGEHLVNMRATDEETSKQSFVVAKKSENWRFYNDSKMKYGWIMGVSKESDVALCADDASASATTAGLTTNKEGEVTWCDAAEAVNTMSFSIRLSEVPVIQVAYLKSYADEMAGATLWVDSFKNESFLVESWWDYRYSVTAIMTIASKPLENVSSILTGPVHLMPSLSAGEHTLHIAPHAQWSKSKLMKWKLLGIMSC